MGFSAGESNLYSYVGSDPIGSIDPLGLERDDTAWLDLTQLLLGVAAFHPAATVPATLTNAAISIERGDRFGALAAGLPLTRFRSLGGLVPLVSRHTLFDRMATRGITDKMINVCLRKGSPYWDPKNRTVNYVLDKGFASGESLLVAQNPVTGVITTVIKGYRLIRQRMSQIVMGQ